MSTKYILKKNTLGFYEIEPKPNMDELNKYYSEKYYQNNHSTYEKNYSDEELTYFSVEAEIALNTLNKFSSHVSKNLLDLGCGEGFFANYFYNLGWEVKCVDFSKDGLLRHNPSLISKFIESDLLSYLDTLDANEIEFGLVNLDNVLEHVINPIGLLSLIKKKIKKNTFVRIEVPNDFSGFQSLLVERGCTKRTWISPPEHLSYFNKDSFLRLLKFVGFNVRSLQADFPIEQFILNEHSNYSKNKKYGKSAHTSRVVITNYLAKKNLNRFIDYREASADLDFGRLLTAYVTL